MIAALVLAWCLTNPQAGSAPTVVPIPVDRVAILARDPSRLPRAPKDTWQGFDIKQFDDATVKGGITRAGESIVRGDFIAALGELISILESRADFPPALHMSGVLYYRLQRYGDSATMFARYLEVAPDRVGDTRMLGHDLYTLGRYSEARTHFERVVAAAPKDAEALRGLALSLWRLGEPDAALTNLARAIEIAPKNDELWSWKATVAFDAGDNEVAKEAAEHALSLDAYESRTWFTLARILDETGQTIAANDARTRFEALARSTAAVRRAEARLLFDPTSAERMTEWIDACVAHGAPGPVRQALQRLSLFRPDSKQAFTVRAELDACRLLHDEDRGNAAARDLERAAGDDSTAWKSLLAWFEATGDETGAARARSHLKH